MYKSLRHTNIIYVKHHRRFTELYITRSKNITFWLSNMNIIASCRIYIGILSLFISRGFSYIRKNVFYIILIIKMFSM